MTQPLFPSTISTQSPSVEFLTFKTMVRKNHQNNGHTGSSCLDKPVLGHKSTMVMTLQKACGWTRRGKGGVPYPCQFMVLRGGTGALRKAVGGVPALTHKQWQPLHALSTAKVSETPGQWCTVRDMMHEVRAEPPDHSTGRAL